jgi:hypothetical protein
VATGWRPHVLTGVEALSSQRRPLNDPLGLQGQIFTAAAAGPEPFGSLVAGTSLPAVSRAHLLHLLWHRRLDVDLREPLGDATLAEHTDLLHGQAGRAVAEHSGHVGAPVGIGTSDVPFALRGDADQFDVHRDERFDWQPGGGHGRLGQLGHDRRAERRRDPRRPLVITPIGKP